ncbi:MAG: DUF58 domain-containing protein [Methanoregula sp.]|nr:DUF58 domain-containing protein [Methanoregula sp.]
MRRCAQGLSLVIIVIISCAYILDDLTLLLAGGILLAALLGQYLLFLYRFRGIVTSVAVQRSLERSQVRKGMILRVETTVTITVPPPMTARISDSIPLQVAIQDGDTSIPVEPDLNSRTYQLKYRIMPVMHGNCRFPGISLTVRNVFFENSIALFADPFSGPELLVQPVGMFDPSNRQSTAESHEVEKLKVVSGFGIRALREYYMGDDLRRIDWKLSAKHNKLYVREYTGMVNLPPLLIVDLPWRGAPYPEADLNRMVSVVAGQAEHAIRFYQYVSILVISGANILHFTPEEKDLQHCMSVLREWMHPAERMVHEYHVHDRADIRGNVRHLETVITQGGEPGSIVFSGNLRKQYLRMMMYMQATAFTGQIARTLSSVAIDECYLFSLGCGDKSHIRQIIRQAKIAKIIVHIRLPVTDIATRDPISNLYREADTVEAFA